MTCEKEVPQIQFALPGNLLVSQANQDLFVRQANLTEKIEAISMCTYEQLFSHSLLFKYEGRKADLYVKINTTFQLPGSLEQQCREMMEGALFCAFYTFERKTCISCDSTSAWFAVDQICRTYLLSAKYMSGTMGECRICLAFPCSRNLWEHAVVGMCSGTSAALESCEDKHSGGKLS